MAFLWELLSAGFSVLISDLDVVWLNGHWQRWMTWADAAAPPVREASLIALADVLVTTDELDHAADAKGRRPSTGQDLNTGVVHFRAGPGALAMVQQWRKAMLARKGDKNLNENVNDQSLFNQVVRGNELEGARLAQWLAASNAPAAARAAADPAAALAGAWRLELSLVGVPGRDPSSDLSGPRASITERDRGLASAPLEVNLELAAGGVARVLGEDPLCTGADGEWGPDGRGGLAIVVPVAGYTRTFVTKGSITSVYGEDGGAAARAALSSEYAIPPGPLRLEGRAEKLSAGEWVVAEGGVYCVSQTGWFGAQQKLTRAGSFTARQARAEPADDAPG